MKDPQLRIEFRLGLNKDCVEPCLLTEYQQALPGVVNFEFDPPNTPLSEISPKVNLTQIPLSTALVL